MDIRNADYRPSHASRACVACKLRKTRCDKAQPSCSICKIKSWRCRYPVSRPPFEKFVWEPGQKLDKHDIVVHKTWLDLPSTENMEYKDVSLGQSRFPAIYFLDTAVFDKFHLETPQPSLSIPTYISNMLGDYASIRATTENFFESIHWMPIISKKRFYHQLLNPLSSPRADVVLLILCMKLLNWKPCINDQEPRSTLYLVVKEFYSDMEASGSCSVHILQSGVFLSLYEFGHAIYPAAYMSIAACARYGTSHGFDKREISVNQNGITSGWAAAEERNRAWWSVLILDRCINLGNPRRALATHEPETSSILPIDDDAWNNEAEPSENIYTITSPSTLKMGRFARFAQAAHLLGRVFQNVLDRTMCKEFHDQEVVQLHRTLRALIGVSRTEAWMRSLEFCNQTAVCYSALLTLQYPKEARIDNISMDSEQKISPKMVKELISYEGARISKLFLLNPEPDIYKVSPFILHFLYQSAVTFSEMGSADEGSGANFGFLENALKVLERRWKAAGAYLEILKARRIANI